MQSYLVGKDAFIYIPTVCVFVCARVRVCVAVKNLSTCETARVDS